jgi:hypothetical protein
MPEMSQGARMEILFVSLPLSRRRGHGIALRTLSRAIGVVARSHDYFFVTHTFNKQEFVVGGIGGANTKTLTI